MLKSTYKPVSVPSLSLPEGWTEYTAPSGHKYYYNDVTKKSTYIRPEAQRTSLQSNAVDLSTTLPLLASPIIPDTSYSCNDGRSSNGLSLQSDGQGERGGSRFRGSGDFRANKYISRNSRPKDRAISKHDIPQCEPWLLVKTKLGRRFVYNPEQKQSFWRFPPEVMTGVVEYDRQEREIRQKLEEERSEHVKSDNVNLARLEYQAPEDLTPTAAPKHPSVGPFTTTKGSDSESEYEEVEVTDDENEQEVTKRAKMENDEAAGPMEFNEDDIAYQLEAMGHDYNLDPGEYGGGNDDDLEEGAEGLPLTEADSRALFRDMLDDYGISPYKTWENALEGGQFIEDDRYIVLPNMRSRKAVWSDWSKDRIQRGKERREKEEKKDPKILYFAFLQTRATPKLYWPEFRRKYQKEPEMRNSKITDRDREKWYREYISRLKLPESTLKADVVQLLDSIPLHTLNRSTTLEALPMALLTDLRFISLRSSIRDGLVEEHISTLPIPPEELAISPEEEEARSRETVERRRRENALAQRQKHVQQKKRKQQEALTYSKGMLREGEQLIERAMQVGKDGLLGHIHKSDSMQMGGDSG